uniref:Uncharacterized protein n=1 Tax=Amphilophus citrinellus TaxID=61819 RepID=A0A3Q0S497_AMPCI
MRLWCSNRPNNSNKKPQNKTARQQTQTEDTLPSRCQWPSHKTPGKGQGHGLINSQSIRLIDNSVGCSQSNHSSALEHRKDRKDINGEKCSFLAVIYFLLLILNNKFLLCFYVVFSYTFHDI